MSNKDVANLIAIAKIESGYNPDAAAQGNWTSASGVFQITDSTAKDALNRLDGTARINNIQLGKYDRFDIESNVDFGIAIYLDKKIRSKSDDVGEIYKKWNSNPDEYNKYLDSLRIDSNHYLDKIKTNTPITISQIGTVDFATNTKNDDTAYNYFSDGKLKSITDHWLSNDGSVLSEVNNFIESGNVGSILKTNINVQGEKTGYFVGVGDSISLDHTRLTMAPDSHISIFGEGNTFTSIGSGVWANLVGSDTHVNFTQSGNVVGFAGLRQSYIGAGNTVWLNSAAVSSVEGNNNRVVMDGSGCYAEIHGSNTTVDSSGTGQRIGLTGANQHVNASASDVWFHSGSNGAIGGNDNRVVLNGSGGYAEIYGANTIVDTSGTGQRIGLTGANHHVNASGSDVWLHSGSNGSIGGNDNRVVLNGSGGYAEIYGANTIIDTSGTGQRIGLTGNNQRVTASSSDVWLHSGSNGVIGGNDNRVVLNGSGGYAEIYGANTIVDTSGTGQRIGLTGANQHVNASGSDVWIHGGGDGVISGNNNNVVLNGSNGGAEIFGSNTNVTAIGTSERIGLTGDNQHVTASGSDVWFYAGSDGALIGTNNTMVANGGNIQAFIFGSDTRLISDSAENTFTFQGARETISANNDAVWFFSDSDYKMNGNGNTVVYNGNRIDGRVIGDNTKAILKGDTNIIYLEGHNLTIKADYDVITLGPNSDAVIYGCGNTFYKDSTSRATFPDEPNRNMNDPSGKSPAELAALMLSASRGGYFTPPMSTYQSGQFSDFETQIIGKQELSFDPSVFSYWIKS